MNIFRIFFFEYFQPFFIKLFEKILDYIIPVVYADSDSESDSESESNSSLSSAMTTYSFSHMNAVGIHHPADPSNVRPEDFSQPTQNPAQMNNAQQSMDTLLYNIYTERFPNNQLLFGIIDFPFYSTVDPAAYHQIEHP